MKRRGLGFSDSGRGKNWRFVVKMAMNDQVALNAGDFVDKLSNF
jgi:hypothetical protein